MTDGTVWQSIRRDAKCDNFKMRELHSPDPEWRVLNYPLLAWVRGHYARDTRKPVDSCPYESDKGMARAWMDGWQARDSMGSHTP